MSLVLDNSCPVLVSYIQELDRIAVAEIGESAMFNEFETMVGGAEELEMNLGMCGISRMEWGSKVEVQDRIENRNRRRGPRLMTRRGEKDI
jgi:hypothetical protein